jgi:hypothetical protein
MRRFALLGPLLGIVLILPGCVGMGDFLTDTVSYGTNPNRPLGDSTNMRRVQGLESPVEAMVPESGNVWPKGVEPLPTLQDLESEGRRTEPPRPARPPGTRTPVGSATLPGEMQPSLYQTGLYQTLTGPAPVTGGTERYQTVNTLTGPAIAVPNANGTATLIRADGSVETVPVNR